MESERDIANLNSGSIIVKRASRLSIAIHRVSDFLEPIEALRISSREASVELIRLLVSYTGTTNEKPAKVIKDITDTINRLNVLFDVLVNSQIVSEEVGNLIKDEIMSLREAVEKYSRANFGYVFSMSEFMAGLDNSLPLYENKVDLITAPAAKLTHRNSDIADADQGQRGSSGPKGDRQSKIVDFIKKNGPSSIKDLAAVVRGCSEKTIQRELTDLIDHGLLRREGERRWSKYVAE